MTNLGEGFHRVNTFIRRVTSERHKFNLQYSNKTWDGLWSVPELARYSIIAGYTKFFSRQPRILDLGCGEGILQQKFSLNDYSFYLGVDISDVAIKKAKEQENVKTYFQVANLNCLAIDGKFDVIIYNESLYYLNNPLTALRSIFSQLKPGGIFIISMHKDGPDRERLWLVLDEILELKDKTTVCNKEDTSWTVGVYSLRG